MKRSYHGEWMDALPSRFINEIPDENIKKSEIETASEFKDDFEFNQDINIDFDGEYRSPGWERFKKRKLLK